MPFQRLCVTTTIAALALGPLAGACASGRGVRLEGLAVVWTLGQPIPTEPDTPFGGPW
jgi:hypothetical protein